MNPMNRGSLLRGHENETSTGADPEGVQWVRGYLRKMRLDQ